QSLPSCSVWWPVWPSKKTRRPRPMNRRILRIRKSMHSLPGERGASAPGALPQGADAPRSPGKCGVSTERPEDELPIRIWARHYATGEPVEIVCAGGLIHSIGPRSAPRPDHEAGWVAPALFDLQINGCDGHNFSSERLTTTTVRHVVAACRRHGIGGLCPTLITNSFTALAHGMSVLRQVCESDPTMAAAIPAIHLEG